MPNKTLADEIITIINDNSNDNPAPLKCKVTKVYHDKHVDLETEEGNFLYVPCINGSTSIGNNGILLFPNGNLDDPYCVLNEFGFNQESANKFNYAVIKKEQNIQNNEKIVYEELWVLSNAYYDYDLQRFIKIDETHTSFGIQIQANGTYPGEAELGYSDNVGINIWHNPKKSDVESSFPNWRTDNYWDFYPYMEHNHIGLGLKEDASYWKEFAVFAGWSNSFMIDSYGGMTIGGAGFEIDGNGIFPFTRLTSSKTTINGVNCSLLGLLDNAYHSANGCDDNSTYSWFVGMLAPIDENHVKDNKNASFVVMYNDTPETENQHDLDNDCWNIVFQVNTGGVVDI